MGESCHMIFSIDIYQYGQPPIQVFNHTDVHPYGSESVDRLQPNPCHELVLYGVLLWHTGIIHTALGGINVEIMLMQVTWYNIYIFTTI